MLRTKARFPEKLGHDDGHYESFYIKACKPGGGQAVWIRHTVHKRPGEDGSCALWFTFFDAEAEGPRATKAQFGTDRLSTPPERYIQVNSAELGDGLAQGSVKTGELETRWDLSFADSHEPFFHLPRPFLYDAKLPRTKFLSPYPDAEFNGRVHVGDREIELERWRGMIGHNWGAEHAERWVWIHGAGFDGGNADDYFDMAVGRIKIAGLQTPWVGNGNLVLDGAEHRLGGFERIPSTDVEEEPTSCRFALKGKGIKVRGRVSSEPKNFVGWVYADPVGPEHNTLNCSISDLELEVDQDGATRKLAVTGGAAYEFGTRDKDHGIPIQPYPDG